MYIYSPAGVAEVFDEIKALLSTIKSKTNAHRREFHSFRDQIVGDLRILREDLSNLNDSVNTFSLQQQKHKQQTKAELARLHTSLNTTQSSLTQQVKVKLNTLTANLSQHQQQTAAELAQLLTSLQSSLTTHTQQVNAKLDTLTTSLSQHKQWTTAELAQIQASANTSQSSLETANSKLEVIDTGLSQHKQQTAAELQASLNTTQSSLETLNSKMEVIEAGLSQHQQQSAAELTEIQTSLNTTQSSLETALSKLEMIGTGLSQHKQHTAAELAQIQSSLTTSKSYLVTHSQQVNAKLNTLTTSLSQHQQESAAELAQIRTSLNTTQYSLTTHTQQVNARLNTSLSQYKQQTITGLAQIKTALSTTQSSLTNHTHHLNQRLNTVNSNLEGLKRRLSQHEQETEVELRTSFNNTQFSLETVNSKLSTLTMTISQLSTNHQELQANISNMGCMDTEESLQLHQTMLNNLTHQLQTILRIHRNETDVLYSCGGTEGWRRVVYLNMTNPNTTCPSGWQLTGYSKRTCGRVSDARDTCDSVTFTTGREYSKVCGRMKAYQWGGTDAFQNYHSGRVTSINGAYVDGVSITHGSPQRRQHIWTFVAGLSESNPTWNSACPCDASINIRVPAFVDEDYFCESAVNGVWGHNRHRKLLSNDPLWDRENCLSSSTCCSLHNPPYFVKQLPTPTTDDIEARICLNYGLRWENLAVELVELYVQ